MIRHGRTGSPGGWGGGNFRVGCAFTFLEGAMLIPRSRVATIAGQAGAPISAPDVMRNVMRRKTVFVVLTIALATLLVAAACGGGGDDGPALQPTSTPVPTAPSEAPTAAPDVAAGGVGWEFTRLFSDPPTLDPALTSDTSSAFVVIEVFSGLVTIDEDLNIVPDIALRWDVSNDERTYTFHLRNDVKFHDGKAVKAHDFKYSMERALDPGRSRRWRTCT